MPSTRPNFLIIQADQLAAQALPCYGHPVVQAPNLSRLAAEGVVFDNAYCNFPLCAPSRAAMMTGQLASRVGVYDNACDFSPQVPTFAHYLRQLGYRTMLAGKMHFVGPDQLHGFEERLTTDFYPADYAWTPDWERPERLLEWYHNMIDVVQAGVCTASFDLDYGEEVAFASTRRLYSLVREVDERPFCLVVSFTHPHDPYVMTQEYWDRYRDDEIDWPTVPPIPPEQMDSHSRRIYQMCAPDEYAITDQHVRDSRHGYYAAISYVDDKVGQLLQALKATGLDQNTVVIFTADHGDMLGERGLWYKMTFWEWSMRVPLLFWAPGRLAPNRIHTNVSLVDLLPTLVDLAQSNQKETQTTTQPWAASIDGHTLLPLLQGDTSQATDMAIGEYLAEGAVAPCVMLRRGQYKYIHSPADPDLLFNLIDDPHELHNLATNPDYAATLQGFRHAVAQRWDLPTLHQQILASQRQRRLVSSSLMQGKITPWDYTPPQDGSQQYVRNTLELWELMKRTRFPVVDFPTPVQAVTRYANLPKE